MILVTTGGGEDGLSLIRTYLLGLRALGNEGSWKSLIITGPELSGPHKREVIRLSSGCSGARVIEFTREMMTYVGAADVVVAMAGYNTICEILSLRKRAVIVPRIAPVAEQRIRAERMARLSLFRMIHPAELTPQTLMHAVKSEVEALAACPQAPASIDLDALGRIGSLIRQFSPERAAQDRVRPGGGVRRKSA
jgi:predicted glycosyltransferase